MTKEALVPFAIQRHLSDLGHRGLEEPTATAAHTNGANIHGNELGKYFESDGGKADSHFDIDEAGQLFQYIPLDHKAMAQAKGNDHVVSYETWDGGDPETPWNDAQVKTIVRLLAWLHTHWGISLAVSTSSTGPGAGWHSKYKEWNPNKHGCPGPVRVKQLLEVVLPAARAAVAPPRPVVSAPRKEWMIIVKSGSPEELFLKEYPNAFGDRPMRVLGPSEVAQAHDPHDIGFGVYVEGTKCNYIEATRLETLLAALKGEGVLAE